MANSYPISSIRLSYLGFGLLYLGDYNESITIFNEAIKFNSENFLPYMGLGKVYLNENQPELAQQYFKRAEAINPYWHETGDNSK